jgi:hypothetical protein
MDFREYDRQSGGSSMHSPTPACHHPSFQPVSTAIIEEVAETYDPMDPLDYRLAPADLLADVCRKNVHGLPRLCSSNAVARHLACAGIAFQAYAKAVAGFQPLVLPCNHSKTFKDLAQCSKQEVLDLWISQ